jgi:Uma2 family endonuclease
MTVESSDPGAVEATAPPEERPRPYPEPEPPRGEWWSDEPEMENYRHLMQMLALIATLRWHWRDRSDFFVAGNLSVYFSDQCKRNRDFRGPDFFVALGVDGARPRRSWVVWQEGGKYPNVIVELLSDSTAANDRGEKKQIYQDVFRTPEYYLFDPETAKLEGFRLVAGRYQPIEPDSAGRLASTQLELLLGVRDAELRFYEPSGELVPKPEDVAALAEQEHRRAEQERQRADAAEAQLRALQAKLGRRGAD